MRPILFQIGSLDVPAFFFMIMIASLAACFSAMKFAKEEGLSEVAILDMAIIAVIGSIIGARVFHVLVEAPAYYWADPIRVFYFWQGGFVSLGAFIFSITGWTLYLRWKKYVVTRYLDIGALVAPIIIFFVRAGCLFTGCCYGKPTDLPIGIVFNNPASTAFYYYPGTSLFPTQIINMINAIVMFGFLFFVYKKRKFFGQVGAVFLIYYGISRFCIEFLRGDVDRGVYFGDMVSTGQLVMIITLLAGLIMYKVLSSRRKNDQPL